MTLPVSPGSRRARIGFVLVVLLFALFLGDKAILFDTFDADCFWHLRVAEELAKLPFPGPMVDNLSFASDKKPWTSYSWLAELAMRKIWDIASYRAAIVVEALLATGIGVLMALSALEMSRRADGSPRLLAASVALVFGVYLCLRYLSFRPVTGAIFMLALCAWLLLRDRRLNERSAAVWLILPIAALTINLHPFALFIPLWVGALWAGSIWERLRPAADRDAAGRGIRRYGAMLLGSILACLLTPMLPGVLRMAVQPFVEPLVEASNIVESEPLYFDATGKAWLAVIAVVLACMIAGRRRLRVGEWLWLAGSLILLLKFGRMAPVFALVAVPLLAATLPRLSDRVLTHPVVWGILAMSILLHIYRIATAFPGESQPLSTWLNRNGPDALGYPCAAADFVDQQIPPRSGHLINEFDWGGYLEWRLGGKYQAFMDGRTQIFPRQFWKQTYLGTPAQRREALEAAGADVAILPKKNSAFRSALTEMGWRTVYQDDRAEVLVPPKNPTTGPVAGENI